MIRQHEQYNEGLITLFLHSNENRLDMTPEYITQYLIMIDEIEFRIATNSKTFKLSHRNL